MTLLVRASVGIAMFPEHGRDVETLMQRADIAMYSAKARGVGHEVYSASRDGHSRARLALIGELPDAIESGQIVVHYQPKFNLDDRRDRRRRGARALGAPAVRPARPGRVPAARRADRPDAPADPARARRRARPVRPRGATRACDLPVAVNLGAPNLLDLGLPVDVHELLAKWDVDPRCSSWRSPRRSSPPTRCA